MGKSYLGTQDDSISDEDAVKKYAEYKLESKRQQLNEFFVSHKDEEWFKLKYHPEDSTKRKEECKAALEKRIDVFIKFMDEDKLNTISIDGDQSDTLVKLFVFGATAAGDRAGQDQGDGFAPWRDRKQTAGA